MTIYRNKKYMKWIDTKPCVICGRKSTHHHEPMEHSGTAIKGSDYQTIPLCHECHRLRHDQGKHTFWMRYFFTYQTSSNGIDYEALIDFCLARMIIGYMSEYIGGIHIGCRKLKEVKNG